MEHTANQAVIRGTLLELPQFSHENHGNRFYRFVLEVPRLSGAVDHLPVIAREEALNQMDLSGGTYIEVRGQIRSFNNHSAVGQRLLIFVFADSVQTSQEEPCNQVLLNGTICKAPIYRRTPLGREICDVMLAGAPVLPALGLPALHPLGPDCTGHLPMYHRRHHLPHRPPAKQALPEGHRRWRRGPHRL